MIDRALLRVQLGVHEGRKRFVYDDVTGKPIGEGTFLRGLPTVGVGRNLTGKGLADDEIEYLLDNDINDALTDAMKFRWFAALDPVRRAVIVELVFNMGYPKLQTFPKFIRAMAEQRFGVAAAELANSRWQKQVDPKLGDGKGRADVLIAMIQKGEWQEVAMK